MRRGARIAVSLLTAFGAGAAPSARAAEAPRDTTGMIMKGDQAGTAFRSLTVEGEDRVHFEIERPSLELALDPATAPGLDWGSAADVLDRSAPDGVAPYLGCSTTRLSPFLARPWLHLFASGDVARFRPQLEGVESWRLTVVDSRGQVVTHFEGKGKPPEEIAWDGRSSAGEPSLPGRTYSYVLEARDRAGNKRSFVGQGFELPAYRFKSAAGTTLAFTGAPAAAAVQGASPHVLEAASWLNQMPAVTVLRVTATARTQEQANGLAASIARGLTPLLVGNAARVQTQVRVEADAPVGGTVQIGPSR